MSAASDAVAAKRPVSSFVDPTFGKVLSRIDKQVLYYWQVEKKAGGKIRCVGSCAKAWPPLIVKSAAAVPRKFVGLSGTFGTIRRPNGKLQVTRNKLPVYTYAHERPSPGALQQRRRLVRRSSLETLRGSGKAPSGARGV